jgi:tRNA nucleotidyltransferase/poly(A) polymerase
MDQTLLRAPWLQAIARAFADHAVYAVGGAVRNALMDLPVSDVDLCGKLRPKEVQAQCVGTDVEVRLRAAHLGTVELHTGGHMAEYTTFRKDSYQSGHQPSRVRFAKTVEEDALRRDFSVNALYTPLSDPSLVIDLVGGMEHIRRRELHTVTRDPDRVLKDDGLRILRAARFQAELGFTPTNALLDSARKYAALLNDIAAERKRDELKKLLESDAKYPSLVRSVPPVSAGLATLVRVGAWPKLFGELPPTDLTALDRAKKLDAGGKLVLLYREKSPDVLFQAMAVLRFAKRKAEDAASALAVFQALSRHPSEAADALRFGLPALRTATTMLTATGADPAALQRAENLLGQVQNKRLPESLRELAVGGNDLLKLCAELNIPKERIGAALQTLWRDAVNGTVGNEREALLDQARRYFIDSQNREC